MKHRVRRALAIAIGVAVPFTAAACIDPPPPPDPDPEPESTVDAHYADLPTDNTVNLYDRRETGGQLRRHAQVFTAGRTGTLDKVSAIFGLSLPSNPTVPITITVETLDAQGKPSGNVIGEGVWDGPLLDPDTFSDVPLTDTAEVETGQQYALVFYNPAPTSMVLYLDAPDYPGGASFEGWPTESWAVDPYDDVPFKTWVR